MRGKTGKASSSLKAKLGFPIVFLLCVFFFLVGFFGSTLITQVFFSWPQYFYIFSFDFPVFWCFLDFDFSRTKNFPVTVDREEECWNRTSASTICCLPERPATTPSPQFRFRSVFSLCWFFFSSPIRFAICIFKRFSGGNFVADFLAEGKCVDI